MRRVVISSDAHPEYAFYLPLTALVWSLRGWRPLAIVVGDEAMWRDDPRLRAALAGARDVCGGVQHINLSGRRTSTVAQVSRLFGAHVPGVRDDDLLLTSDVDMWPVGPWVGGDLDEAKGAHVYYANAYMQGGRVTGFPMCYLAMRARTWREVVGGEPPLAIAIERALSKIEAMPEVRGSYRGVPLREWNFDENYFRERFFAWPGYPEKCQLVPRDLDKHGERRIDRGAWRDVDSLDGYADAHLLRPGFSDENWPRVRRLLALLIPTGWLKWVDGYREIWSRS